MSPPPPAVLRAFGASAAPKHLPGGQGTSWQAGAIVLKPADEQSIPTLTWLHGVRDLIRPTPLRLAVPLVSEHGRVVEDGWSATAWLEGGPPRGDWTAQAEAARRLADAFSGIDPHTLPRRDDRWAAADRAVWGEAAGPLDAYPLMQALTPVHGPTRIVHGDLAGNLLVHPAAPPAVIDLSLYARPVEWSVAVLAVDAVCSGGAPASILDSVGADAAFPQFVARAALFRMTTDALRGTPSGDAYRTVEGWLADHLE